MAPRLRAEGQVPSASYNKHIPFARGSEAEKPGMVGELVERRQEPVRFGQRV